MSSATVLGLSNNDWPIKVFCPWESLQFRSHADSGRNLQPVFFLIIFNSSTKFWEEGGKKQIEVR